MLERSKGLPSTRCCSSWFCITSSPCTQEQLRSSLQRPVDKKEKGNSLPTHFRSCFTFPEQQEHFSFMNIAVQQQRAAWSCRSCYYMH